MHISCLIYSTIKSLHNSVSLVQKVENVRVPITSKFVLFEVKKLLPSVVYLESCKLVERWSDKEIVNKTMESEILALTEDYLQFHNDIYATNDSQSMGNPIPF